MKNWIKNHLFGIFIISIISLFPLWIIAQYIHYIYEPKHKIYVEWTVYHGANPTKYSGTYTISGEKYSVRNYWQSAGKYSGSYRVVSIIDDDNWGSYIENQSVCIYTGLNDVQVNNIKIVE